MKIKQSVIYVVLPLFSSITINNHNLALTHTQDIYNVTISSLTFIPDLGNTTERIYASTPATEGTGGVGEGGGGEEDDKSKEEKKGGRAGAGEVTAWLLAGLALFLVMVLALALCTKTAQHSKPYHVQDSQPSVGTVYFKGAKEPGR